ncbi:MAG: rod shape-determining protein MreD [Gammaproteobacteria bacterium]
MSGIRSYCIIVMTLIIALILSILPFPHWYVVGRPLWLPLVAGYWCLAAPRRMGILTAWLAGFCFDAARASPLGEHALALSVIAYVIQRYHLQIRTLHIGQQMLTLGGIFLVYEFLIFWINGIISKPGPLLPYSLPVFVSVCLWPPVFMGLRFIRRRYRVH